MNVVDAIDGRTARRNRNRDAVLDALIELADESNDEPTIERIAERAGVSYRSVYRYFDDRTDLMLSAITRVMGNLWSIFDVENLGHGPLDERIEQLTTVRVAAYRRLAPLARTAVHRRANEPAVAEGYDRVREYLREQLAQQAQVLGLAARISWCGAMAQGALLAQYRAADMFALASRIAQDGDRDGLPNVLMEAQSQGLACVATDISAIHELIDNGVTGILVAPESPEVLADAIHRLITDPMARATLGEAGRARVAAAFGLQRNVARLAEKFGLAAQSQL